jgi:DDE family transposase
VPKLPAPIAEADLRQWRLIEAFGARVGELATQRGVAASWLDPRRHLLYGQYLSLFLFGLVNPVLRTVRALCAASALERVQREVCGQPVSLGSFSEAQSLVDPAFLEALFGQLAGELHGPAPKDPREAALYWLAQDSSLWRALPRMEWALYGGGRTGAPNRAVRLHLGFHLLEDKPVVAQVSTGQLCERKAWKQSWQRGAAYVGDRYYGEDYRLFEELSAHGCHFVVRLCEQAAVNVEQELPVSAFDHAAGVRRQAWVRLGADPRVRQHCGRVRVVWVETATAGTLRLATNLDPGTLSAELVARVYRRRWQIECFFRWVKCLLGCRHWLAESPSGVSHQLYLALIAAVLLQQALGRRPNRRMLELIQLYQMGVATLEELLAGLRREADRADRARRKNS